MKKCDYCSEEIQDSAKKCRYCWEWLEKKEDINNDESRKSITNIKFSPIEKSALFYLWTDKPDIKSIMSSYRFAQLRYDNNKKIEELTEDEKEYRKFVMWIDKDLDKKLRDTILKPIEEVFSLRTFEKVMRFLDKKYWDDIKKFEWDNFMDWVQTEWIKEYWEEATPDIQYMAYSITKNNLLLWAYIQVFFDDFSNNKIVEEINNIILSKNSKKEDILNWCKTLLSIIDWIEEELLLDAFKLSIETWEILYELESNFYNIIDDKVKSEYINYFEIIEKIYLFNIVQINCIKERLKWDRIPPTKIIESNGDNTISIPKEMIDKLGNIYTTLITYKGFSEELYKKRNELDKNIYWISFDNFSSYEEWEENIIKNTEKESIIINNKNKISKWKIAFYIIWWISIMWIWKVTSNTIEWLQMFFIWIIIVFLCKAHSNLLKRKLNKNLWKIWEYIHISIAIVSIILFIIIVWKSWFIENPSIIIPFFVFGYFYHKDYIK